MGQGIMQQIPPAGGKARAAPRRILPAHRLPGDQQAPTAERVTLFHPQLGTAEPPSKEGKSAILRPRPSCHRFPANALRLQLHPLAYTLANFRRTLPLPEAVSHESMTTLRNRLVKISTKIVRHERSITLQMAEIMVSRGLFQPILDAIAAPRPLAPARY